MMTLDDAAGLFDGWDIAYSAANASSSIDLGRAARFNLDSKGQLRTVTRDDAQAVLIWNPAAGWESALAADDPRQDLLELYLPICSASQERPITIAHLGQSLDGFIATPSGDSSYVTGPQNILHLHRLRALCDAIVVGAETIAADNPRLTTRLVTGSNPLRVVLDPHCRLDEDCHVFKDGEAATVRACIAGNQAASEARSRGADIMEISRHGEGLDLVELLHGLRRRGCSRIFIEGGGITVSSFLQTGLLDRLHVAVSALLIGDGRPAIRMPASASLQDCLRLQQRVYRMGDDILFDCQLRASAGTVIHGAHKRAAIQRIL